MWNRLVGGAHVYLFLAAGVVFSISLGLLLQIKILLPLLNIAVAYPVLFSLVAQGKRTRAYGTMLFWALCLTIFMICAAVQFPEPAEATVINGKTYVQEMFRWVTVGDTRENRPSQFIPQHLFHFALFAGLSLLSGSVLSLFMGAILMNYMSFYVGSLIRAAHDPLMVAMLGWQPYAIIRVISYVILGIILGEPLICRIVRRKYYFSEARMVFWIALGGVVLDIIIKSLIAPWWGLMLRRFL